MSTWHEEHADGRTRMARVADRVTAGMGSWTFIIIQSGVIVAWILANVAGAWLRWDAYPFILLNLIFSTQAAYASPLILMSQNRQSERDRVQAQHDRRNNQETHDMLRQLTTLHKEGL